MTLFTPNEEQLAISRGLADYLADQFPLDRFRAARDGDRARWSGLAQMGVLGVSLPEADGGMGLTRVDEALVAREAGRHLVSPALIGSILAAHLAARAGLAELRDALLAGHRRAGIAVPVSPAEIRIVDDSSGLFLLVEPDRLRLLECGRGVLRRLDCLDETVSLHAAVAPESQLAASEDQGLALLARLLAAAMLCGQLEATRDMAAEYARTRIQFGRAIGSFQAIKHRCADIALAAELCWSQTLHAADALAADAEDVEFHILTAKLLAGEEALKAARFNIQAHGGMGFTAEVDAHRLMKRAHVLHQLFGDPRSVPAQLLDLPLVL